MPPSGRLWQHARLDHPALYDDRGLFLSLRAWQDYVCGVSHRARELFFNFAKSQICLGAGSGTHKYWFVSVLLLEGLSALEMKSKYTISSHVPAISRSGSNSKLLVRVILACRSGSNLMRLSIFLLDPLMRARTPQES